MHFFSNNKKYIAKVDRFPPENMEYRISSRKLSSLFTFFNIPGKFIFLLKTL